MVLTRSDQNVVYHTSHYNRNLGLGHTCCFDEPEAEFQQLAFGFRDRLEVKRGEWLRLSKHAAGLERNTQRVRGLQQLFNRFYNTRCNWIAGRESDFVLHFKNKLTEM